MRGTSRSKSSSTSHARRSLSTAAILRDEKTPDSKANGTARPISQNEEEQGAMSRRLSEMAEETIDTGSKSDRKLMEDVGFSDELRKQLEERIAQTTFDAQNQKAASEINMPVGHSHCFCYSPIHSKPLLMTDSNPERCWKGHPRYRSRGALDRFRVPPRRHSTDAR